MNTRALIGAYQQASRLKVDCWPSDAVLTHLRSARAGQGAPVQGADAERPRRPRAAGEIGGLAASRRHRCGSASALSASCCAGLDRARRAARQPPRRRTSSSALWPAAQARGISRAAVRARARRLRRPIPMSLDLALRQPEHMQAVGRLCHRTSSRPQRIDTGRRWLSSIATLLAPSRAAYGVDRHILLAIWGIECALRHREGVAQCRPLAGDPGHGRCAPRRRSGGGSCWRPCACCRTVQSRPTAFVGSWAGAAGHTQFIPRPTPRARSTSTRMAGATSGARWRTRWPRPPTISRPRAGAAGVRWGREVPCRPISTSPGRRRAARRACGNGGPPASGRSRAATSCPRGSRCSSFCLQVREGQPSWSRGIFAPCSGTTSRRPMP